MHESGDNYLDLFRAHAGARFDFVLDIPMQYLARTIEIAFLEHTRHDHEDFRFSPAIWVDCVAASRYVPAQEELRLVMSGEFDDEL